MSDNETVGEAEAAIEALFNDFKQTSFPDGWETAILESATMAPVIRIAPEAASSQNLPAPIRVHAPATVWTRHRLTAARLAAAIAVIAGAAVLFSLLSDNGDVEVAAETTSTTSAIAVPTTATSTSSAPPDPTPSTSAAAAAMEEPRIVTTTAPPPPPDLDPTPVPNPPSTTVPMPSTQATVATVDPSAVDPTTTIPPTTTPPTTTAPSTTLPSTTLAPSTTVTTVVAATPDVEIRGLTVSKVTATSAVVSFRTNDCSGARYQLSGGINTWADGYPSEKQCWNDHYAILGRSPFSNGELAPDTKYIARITTYAADGTTANARITFKTLPLEFELPPVLDPEADPAP